MHTSSITICQYEKGYRYNSDTILLYHFIHSFTCKGTVLDVGFGSGVLALLIKRDFPACCVSGVDLQEENVTLANHNKTINSLEVEFICDDFSNFEGKNFDLIVSNPPFYHLGSQRSSDEHLAKSRYSLYLPLEVFVKNVFKVLKSSGRVCFCYDAKQIVCVLETLKRYKMTPEIIQFVHTKVTKDASIVLISAKKSSKSLAKVMPPFVLHEQTGYSTNALKAYENANMVSKEWIR